MIESLIDKFEITETKRLLSIEQIKNLLTDLFNNEYKDKIEFCYLFGSYAKVYAKEDSDVDLCVATCLKGLDFVGLIESIRKTLYKKVDLIRFSSLENNLALTNDIMKDGMKIYG